MLEISILDLFYFIKVTFKVNKYLVHYKKMYCTQCTLHRTVLYSVHYAKDYCAGSKEFLETI